MNNRLITPIREAGTLLVRCGALFDGHSKELRRNVNVLIEDGKILSVGSPEAAPDNTQVLDLPEYTCLPGLIDMHTHLQDTVKDNADLSVFHRRSQEEQVMIGRKNAQTTLEAGFTTVRNVGTYLGLTDIALRDQINRGDFLGPRMQVCGFYLTKPGGGGDLLIPGIPEKDIPDHLRMGVARGAEEFRLKAKAAIDQGADFLKIIASGAVLDYGGKPQEAEMSIEEIGAVVEVAHAAGIKVAAHAHAAQSIKDVISAGVDTVEHASFIDEEAIALARERNVALSMDVYGGDYINEVAKKEHWPEEFLEKNVDSTETQRRGFTKAHQAVVPIVFGTDSSVYPHGDNAKQFKIMTRLGMTPAEAIVSATSLAAKYMGWEDQVGAVIPGLYGDLIAVHGNPLEDISLLEDVSVVIKGGVIVKSPVEK